MHFVKRELVLARSAPVRLCRRIKRAMSRITELLLPCVRCVCKVRKSADVSFTSYS